MFYLNNPPPIKENESLEFFEHYQSIGQVSSGQSQTILLPEANIKYLHISKSYAPQSYSDRNIIYVACLDEDGLYIIGSTSVSFAMNGHSEYLFLPPGTVSVRFTRDMNAPAASITLYTHFYGV